MSVTGDWVLKREKSNLQGEASKTGTLSVNVTPVFGIAVVSVLLYFPLFSINISHNMGIKLYIKLCSLCFTIVNILPDSSKFKKYET